MNHFVIDGTDFGVEASESRFVLGETNEGGSLLTVEVRGNKDYYAQSPMTTRRRGFGPSIPHTSTFAAIQFRHQQELQKRHFVSNPKTQMTMTWPFT